jgi:YidC/Oxa1 family membrane protein insertase
MNVLIAPFVNALFGFYYLAGNLGWSVVLVTILIRILLIPLVLPSLRSAKKMNELQPKLKQLQREFGKEKEKLAKAQMELYKKEGINPLSGCLPQILQIAVLIIFFSAFNLVTNYSVGKGTMEEINRHLIPSFQIKPDFKFVTSFLGSNLEATPAKIFGQGVGLGLVLPLILLLGSGALQYFSSKLMMPAPKLDEKAVAVTKDKEDDMMGMMRTQSLYMMPLMTIFIGWNFSLGMLLYWFVNSAVMLGQQVVVGKMDARK